MSNFVLYGGDVYSSADPFATAISVNGSSVVWVGSDEAALTRDEPLSDLAGDFVTPGFVDAGLDLRSSRVDSRDLLPSGITTVHAFGPSERLAWLQRDPELDVEAYPTDASAGQRALEVDRLHGMAATQLPKDRIYLLVDSADALRLLEEFVSDADSLRHARRYGWRIFLNISSDASAVDTIADSGLATTLDPAAHTHDLALLLSKGAQLSFALTAGPWQVLRRAIFAEHGISGRAAFNCVTRFAHRAAGNFEGGTLSPGAAASMVRWKVSELVVQAADERVAAWSTDPRSGTPGLPNLSPDLDLPRALAVWSNGDLITREGADCR